MSKQKGRRVPPPDPAQIRRGRIATVEATDEAAWNTAEEQRTLDTHVVAAGVAMNRETGLYHTWLSLYGTDLTSWYVGDDGATAQAFLLAIEKLTSEWSGTDDDMESMDALMAVATEQSTNPRATLPDDQVRDLLAQVAAHQLRKN